MKLSIVTQSVSFSLLLISAPFTFAENTTLGTNAGTALTSGEFNVLIGLSSGGKTTTGYKNLFIGNESGFENTTGNRNVFAGYHSGYSNTTGFRNVFIGDEAGLSNTTGRDNIYIGEDAGRFATTAHGNTAVGQRAMHQNIAGIFNTALGHNAGYDIGKPNSAGGEKYNGSRNTAVGNSAGYDIGGGSANTMIGDNAGPHTESGDFNTFVGFQAGFDNNRTNNIQNANFNTALGAYAGYSNREGENNVWVGSLADSSDWNFNHESEVSYLQTAGSWSPAFELSSQTNRNNAINRTTVLGNRASVLSDDGIGLGFSSRVAGVGSIAIGTNAATTHTNSITIGYGAMSKANNSVVIGNDNTISLAANIDAVTSLGNINYRFKDVYTNKMSVNAATNDDAVIDLFANAGAQNNDKWSLAAAKGGNFTINSLATGSNTPLLSLDNTGNATLSGDLTLNSDRRLKDNISSIENASAIIKQLDGKRYQWKTSLQRDRNVHLGLIAQNVETVLPELITENEKGIKSVNYIALTPVLINALNEQQAQLEHQQRLIENQQQQINQLLKLVQP